MMNFKFNIPNLLLKYFIFAAVLTVYFSIGSAKSQRAEAKLPKSLVGNWIIVSEGEDCGLNEGFTTDMSIGSVGKKIFFESKKVVFGDLVFKNISYTSNKRILSFLDGSMCKDSPGRLPDKCDKLMESIS